MKNYRIASKRKIIVYQTFFQKYLIHIIIPSLKYEKLFNRFCNFKYYVSPRFINTFDFEELIMITFKISEI